eukprot:TRINITY_DN642_c0_g1_i1.p1 TRINITY_DN642_c0_g1~~TRINITY_DN642_c0_g1_i1.p1  ORF type:complete len:277 (+),score=59.79 TRINITY_DN642_c0_g1_i1:55-885(+)
MSRRQSIFDKLTDSSQYTGAHKHRFDADGKGRGIQGRVDGTGGIRDLSQITRPSLHPEGAANALKEKGSVPVAAARPAVVSKPVQRAPSPSFQRAPSPSASRATAKPAPGAAGGSIFDRLTDVKTYTGAHKERFNADGSGRGKAGRTDNTGGIGDLSQITRPAISTGGQFTGGSRLAAPQRAPSPAASRPAAQRAPSPAPARRAPSPTGARRPASTSKAGGSIFDRLTDVKTYTGAHKERFNADGSGRGKAGRTDNTGGISDLSQITRPTLGPKVK